MQNLWPNPLPEISSAMEQRNGAHPPSPPPPPPAAAISSVLSDDDLLREILLRLGFPTTLVRAALVSRRWLRLASDPAFLRRFRARHPPRLLGFYHTAREHIRDEVPSFVPLPQPPELDIVLRRAVFRLAVAGASASGDDAPAILNCRNGRLLAAEFPPDGPRVTIISPMHPASDPPALPLIHELPRQPGEILHASCMLLPEDGGDDPSYTLVEFLLKDQEVFAKAVSVKPGILDLNNVRKSASMEIHESWVRNIRRYLLVNGNTIYFLGKKEYILGLSLQSMSWFFIKLPDGVEQLHRMGNLELLRAGDSGLYLIHLKGFQIHVWLRTTDCNIAGNWELVDTICLRQSFGQVAEPNWESGDALVAVHRAEDNVEVFLRVDHVIFHIHIMNRTVNKVFEISRKAYKYFDIFPFMMLWPPTFPELSYDPDQDE